MRVDAVNLCPDFWLLEILDYNPPYTPILKYHITQVGQSFLRFLLLTLYVSQYILYFRGLGLRQ